MMRNIAISLAMLSGFALVLGLLGATNFGSPSLQTELRQHLGASLHPFVVSGCQPTVPSSSLTLDAFACTAIVEDGSTPAQQIPVVQSALSLTLPDSATVWVAIINADIGATPSGWTRESGKRTHYVYQAIAAKPANPVGGLVIAKVTIAASVVTVVENIAFRSALDAQLNRHSADAWGAVGDGTTDDSAAIISMLKAMAASVVGGEPLQCGYFSAGKIYRIDSPLPFSASMCWETSPRRNALIRNHGTSALLYTATYTTGAFVDNLDATLNTKFASFGIIDGLQFEQIGAISGTSPDTATPWAAVVQLVSANDMILRNVRIDIGATNNNNNMDGLRTKFGYRTKLYHLNTSRASATTGGVGINIQQQGNGVYMENPQVQGAWSTGIALDRNTDAFNGGLLDNPNVEGVITGDGRGIFIAADGVVVNGGFIENNKSAIVLGVVGGDEARGIMLNKPFIGTDANAVYLVELNNVTNSVIDIVPQKSWTVSINEFKSGTIANGNKGNIIHWFEETAADTVPTTVLGLDQGANVLKIYGDTTNIDLYQTYSTEAAGSSARVDPHVDTLVAESFIDLPEITHASLGATDAYLVYCTDCALTTPGTDNTCASGGTGALAVRISGTHRCFLDQD